MSDLKYCVTKKETKLFLYGFSTDSLRICGRFAHNMSLLLTDRPLEHEKRHSEPISLLLSNCSTDSLRILHGSDG